MVVNVLYYCNVIRSVDQIEWRNLSVHSSLHYRYIPYNVRDSTTIHPTWTPHARSVDSSADACDCQHSVDNPTETFACNEASRDGKTKRLVMIEEPGAHAWWVRRGRERVVCRRVRM
jgi:hypothetical protein